MTKSCSFFLRPSANIEVQLNQKQTSAADYYTTGNVVGGIVSITIPHGLPLGYVRIYFQGISKIKFHRALQHGRAKTQHTFLCLRQRADEMKISTPTTTSKGDQYHIPFDFVVPDKLPPESCNHFTKSEHIEQSHRNLPPTLGDRGCRELIDDSSTEMACISYRIQVKMSNPLNIDSTLTRSKYIQVAPKSLEQRPVEIRENQLYSTRKIKITRSRPFKSQSGQLFVEALQPQPIRLPDSRLAMQKNPGTTVTIDMEFEGRKNPPKLRTVSSSLRVLTIYGATPWENYPNVIYSQSLGNGNRGLYRNDVPLSKLCIKSVEWIRLEALSHDHKVESKIQVHESDGSTQATKYTSSIVVPINIPSTNNLVPTFHSCFVSRIYLVDVHLSYRQHGVARVPSRVSLVVPLQVIK